MRKFKRAKEARETDQAKHLGQVSSQDGQMILKQILVKQVLVSNIYHSK